ncbi:MAG: cytochrome c [Isosphaeraceae bacterium]
MSTDPQPSPTGDRPDGPQASAALTAPELPGLDPWAGEAPIPRWLLGVCVVLLAWSGYYFNRFGGRFRAGALEGVYHRIIPGPPAPVDPVVLGRQLFTLNCLGCHQENGQGIPGQYPPLAGSEWIHESPARLSRIVLHGLQGPIQVKGQSFDNLMPGFGPLLDDQQAAAVLTFVRQEWGNQADPVPTAAVTAVRASNTDRTTPWTVDELKAATPEDGPTPPDTEPTKSPPGPEPEKLSPGAF